MSEVVIDPFEVVRRELRAATSRHLQRRHRRARLARIVVVSTAALTIITGIAAAASPRIGSIVRDMGGSLADVFDGPTATVEPSATTRDRLQQTEDLQRGIDPERRGDAPVITPAGKVLLHRTVDGVPVEIVAYSRAKGSPTPIGPTKDEETCYSVATGGHGGGGVTCTNAFNPGLPINYGESYGVKYGRVVSADIAGITASTVTNVNIVTSKGVEHAAMGDHAFWWRAQDAMPTAIEVELTDGSTLRRALTPFPEHQAQAG